MSGPYADIIERLEGASGPDRELDIAIVRLIDGDEEADLYKVFQDSGLEYTASIDAVVALVERVLPKVAQISMSIGVYRETASIYWGALATCTRGDAEKLPIALLLALFRALQARDETK